MVGQALARVGAVRNASLRRSSARHCAMERALASPLSAHQTHAADGHICNLVSIRGPSTECGSRA